MKRNLLIAIAGILLIVFTAVAITKVKTANHEFKFQKIQLQNRDSQLKLEQIESKKLNDRLNDGKIKSEQEINQLKQEIEQRKANEEKLKADLQAKIENQNRIAQAEKELVNTVTSTQTAYAAPARASSGSCVDIQNKLAALGVPADQLAAAGQLAMRESTCNEYVVNSIGACGAFQSLPCGKWGSPGTTEYYRGAINYANSRYGGYNQALAHSLANNWY